VGPEDGCAGSPSSEIIDEVAPYRELLRGLKSDPRRIVAAGIMARRSRSPSTTTRIPSCEAAPGARPCWQLETDAVACPFSPPPQRELVVQRDAAPDPATTTRMSCVVEP
jgi:hypothetical protein